MQRLLHASTLGALAHLAAAVVFAVGDDGPAVVAPGQGQVDLVATLWAVFVHPVSAVRGECGPLCVAVAVAPDFGQCARFAYKGVVGRHGAVLVHAHHLAQVVVELLGVVAPVVSLTQGQKQRAVPRLRNTAAKVQVAGHFGFLAEDDLYIFQLGAVLRQAGLGQRRAVGPRHGRCVRLGKAEIQRAVAGECRVGHHIQQTALPARGNGWQAAHGRQDFAVGLDHPQPPRPLGHQKTAFRQKSQRPRVFQPLGHHLCAHVLGAGLGSICCKNNSYKRT